MPSTGPKNSEAFRKGGGNFARAFTGNGVPVFYGRTGAEPSYEARPG